MSRDHRRNIELNLGKGCDNRCVFCATGMQSRDEPGWMSVDEVCEALRSGREQGVDSVGFIGGEPTRYAALPEVVTAARDLGYARIALCTNGRRLASAARLDRLLDAGMTRVALSIHSHRAELEDAITRRRGSFDQKVEAIHYLVQARDAGRLPDGFSLNTVLHAQNVTQLEPQCSFFAKLGVHDIRLGFIRPEVEADQVRLWVPTFARTTPRLLALIEKNESKLGLQLGFADLPLCRYPWELLANPTLRARYLGELRDLDSEVTLYRPEERGGAKRFNWQDQRTTYLKCHVPVCEGCVLRSRCEGLWRGYLELYGDAELVDGPTVARSYARDKDLFDIRALERLARGGETPDG
ncbi:MAG: radical SAM protein [bacterium]